MTLYYCFIVYRQRLELMREMYASEAEGSPTSPGGGGSGGGGQAGNGDKELATGGDPFYDRFPW